AGVRRPSPNFYSHPPIAATSAALGNDFATPHPASPDLIGQVNDQAIPHAASPELIAELAPSGVTPHGGSPTLVEARPVLPSAAEPASLRPQRPTQGGAAASPRSSFQDETLPGAMVLPLAPVRAVERPLSVRQLVGSARGLFSAVRSGLGVAAS